MDKILQIAHMGKRGDYELDRRVQFCYTERVDNGEKKVVF